MNTHFHICYSVERILIWIHSINILYLFMKTKFVCFLFCTSWNLSLCFLHSASCVASRCLQQCNGCVFVCCALAFTSSRKCLFIQSVCTLTPKRKKTFIKKTNRNTHDIFLNVCNIEMLMVWRFSSFYTEFSWIKTLAVICVFFFFNCCCFGILQKLFLSVCLFESGLE